MQSEELQYQSKELQEANEALLESEEKYRNIVETTNEGIWVSDATGRTTYVNERMARMVGYSREELVGKYGWDFADEETEAISKQNFENRRQGINGVHEFKFIHKDGSLLWTLVNSQALTDANGKFIGVLAMLTDITERKQAQFLMKADLEALTIMHTLSGKLLGAEGIESLLQEIMDAAVAIVDAKMGTLQLLEGDSLLIVAHYGHQQPFLEFFESAENVASV